MYFRRLRLGTKRSSNVAAGITSGTSGNPAPISATGLQLFSAHCPVGRNIDGRAMLNTLVCADVAGYVAERTLARRDADERTKP
jgi:hypothetical protein